MNRYLVQPIGILVLLKQAVTNDLSQKASDF